MSSLTFSALQKHKMILTGLTGGASNAIAIPAAGFLNFASGDDYVVWIEEGDAFLNVGSKTATDFDITTAAAVTAVTLWIIPVHPPSVTHVD